MPTVKCPKCSAKIVLPDGQVSGLVPCPSCGTQVRILPPLRHVAEPPYGLLAGILIVLSCLLCVGGAFSLYSAFSHPVTANSPFLATMGIWLIGYGFLLFVMAAAFQLLRLIEFNTRRTADAVDQDSDARGGE